MNFLAIGSLVILALANCKADHGSEEIILKQGGLSGTGTTTRYWDCCKPTCAWPGHVDYKSPVRSCEANGVTTIDPEVQSGCESDGRSYICTDQGGFAINSTLAYGFAAARFINTERNMCCACVLFTFQSDELKDKKMLVQVTNTGNAPESGTNLFDIAMPGSGVGYYTQGCTSQWHSDVSNWGDQYGGVREEADCYNLPKWLWDGCKFRFEWMKGVSNPPVSFVEVECPKKLLSISGCNPVS
uniref:Cellulase n=1 Tax=Chrysomela tremula TaxID=63687 RepID=E7CIS4_CHRTR|nr:endo-beta-1,4-glucanase [Chrysomela tremula]